MGPGPAAYKGYNDIRGLIKGKYRSLIILKTREGEIDYPNNEVPIACYFSRDDLEELPKPKDKHRMLKFFHASSIGSEGEED